MKLKDYVRSKDFKQPLSEHQFKKYECKGKKATNWSLDDIKKIAKFIGIKITGKKKDKWARLEQLHSKLFDDELNNLHNALNDVLVCLRCYFKLMFDEDILQRNKKLKKMF